MSDYISREALPQSICGHCSENSDECLLVLQSPCADYMDILHLPAADVRPVVLCRGCKRYGGRPWENNENGICIRTDCGVGEFDFCSYGEKREES